MKTKVVGFRVREDYPYKGDEVKKATDALLEEMFRILVNEGLDEPIRKNFVKEMEVLSW
jgi:hypothetical protein